ACVVLLGALALLSNSRSVNSLGVSRGPLAFIGRSTAIARISQFMADLLEAGISVPETLQLAGQLTNRKRLRDALRRLANQLQKKAKAAIYLNAPTRMATVFHAMRAEIPTKSRIHLLREISQSYTEKARLRLSWTRGVIEPVTIIFIGLIVGIV